MKVVPLLLFVASSCCFAQSKSQVAGAYELIVCKTSCSFENPQAAIARGIVVLFEGALSRANVEKLGPSGFTEPNEAIRACFSGEQSKDAKTFAFERKKGTMAWSLKDNTLTFSLMRSVDAGYSVDVERDGNGFSGKGVSWGAGVAAPGYTPDIIIGRRIGPANTSACIKNATRPAT